mmetsp:Transcript_26254/g.32843  ORF Transcript_26254/g.32843 Transcript_26254/m.32843 type:complete len:129 (-) Transcript_26254:597-983(-)
MRSSTQMHAEKSFKKAVNRTHKLDLDRHTLGMLMPEAISPARNHLEQNHGNVPHSAHLALSLSKQTISKDKKRFLRLSKKIKIIKKRMEGEQGKIDQLERSHVTTDDRDTSHGGELKLASNNSTDRLP